MLSVLRSPMTPSLPTVHCFVFADCCAEEGQHFRDVRRDHGPGLDRYLLSTHIKMTDGAGADYDLRGVGGLPL